MAAGAIWLIWVGSENVYFAADLDFAFSRNIDIYGPSIISNCDYPSLRPCQNALRLRQQAERVKTASRSSEIQKNFWLEYWLAWLLIGNVRTVYAMYTATKKTPTHDSQTVFMWSFSAS